MAELAQFSNTTIGSAIPYAADTSRTQSAETHAHLGIWVMRMLALDFIFGRITMLDIGIVGILATLIAIAADRWLRHRFRRRELERYSISAESLHGLLETNQKLIVLDLRVPLDFLAHSEIIPGATRISPHEILASPTMISTDDDYVLYCTCPDDQSSETVLEAALKLGFLRVKVLTGGIEAWKQKGYPVEVYTKPFHLDMQ